MKDSEGRIDGDLVWGGNASWLAVASDPLAQKILSKGHTLSCLTFDAEMVAIFGLSDTIGRDIAPTVAELVFLVQHRGALVRFVAPTEAW